MRKRYLVYRCALCNELLYYKADNQSNDDDAAFAESIVQKGLTANSPLLQSKVPMYITHSCEDGHSSTGVAYFAGIYYTLF